MKNIYIYIYYYITIKLIEMSDDRIKELQDFANDFKRRLKNAKEKYELSLSKSIEIENSQKKEESINYKLINKSQKLNKLRQRYVNKFFIK
jgi:predicted RNase H-like nuclease (RuvC/YqgF family)